MSIAISGIGVKFRRLSDDSNYAYEELAEITSISGPDKSRNTIDVTSLDSTDNYKEFIGGLRDAGQIQLEMNFTAATYNKLNADFESEDLKSYEIILPDAEKSSFTFNGLVTNLSMNMPLDDKISATATIKISGVVTEASGSGSGSQQGHY